MKKTYLFITLLLYISHLSAQTQVENTVKTDSVSAPPESINALTIDSTAIIGWNYTSFADIYNWMPGTYYFNQGSTGRIAPGFIFCGSEQQLKIDYDGLLLNDPITEKVNLNTIPVESIDKADIILTNQQRRFGNEQLGQSLRINPINIAANPIRSRVSYRNGTSGYDDIDVRAGMQASPTLAINAGSVLKNYHGTQLYSNYRALKTNLQIQKKLFTRWTVKYILLSQKFDLDMPLYFAPTGFRYPLIHHKDQRKDQGLHIQYHDRFSVFLQYTNLKREFFGYMHRDFESVHTAKRTRILAQYVIIKNPFQIKAGVQSTLDKLESEFWQNADQDKLEFWTNIQGNCSKNIEWYLLLNSKKAKDFDATIEPEIGLTYSMTPNTKFIAWAHQSCLEPSFEAKYINDPFVTGNTNLQRTQIQQAGLALEYKTCNTELFSSVSYQKSKDPIGAVLFQIDDLPVFQNLPDKQNFVVDLNLKQSVIKNTSLQLKSKFIVSDLKQNDIYQLSTPKYYAKAFAQWAYPLFKGDLYTRLRIGLTLTGEQYYTFSQFSNFSYYAEKLDPIVVPYLHGMFTFRDAVIFVALDNFLGQEYQLVYPYSMPQNQFRWGFTWNFND